MVDIHRHDFEERRATFEEPYHFVSSGLQNVYLSGVKYRVCRNCDMQTAEIPGIKKLMMVIARTIVEREARLTGPEIRFLRKRLGIKSVEFARIIGVTAEQVSRWENDHNLPELSADKLIRLFYSIRSGDRELQQLMAEHIKDFLVALTTGGRISDIRARLSKQEWKAEPVLV